MLPLNNRWFQELGIKWLNHLEWLNDNFKKDIKTLKTRLRIMVTTTTKPFFPFYECTITWKETKNILKQLTLLQLWFSYCLCNCGLPHRIIWGISIHLLQLLIYYVMENLIWIVQEHVTIYQSRDYWKVFSRRYNKFKNVILQIISSIMIERNWYMRERIIWWVWVFGSCFIGVEWKVLMEIKKKG
jgi:hypothetical protein